MHLVLYSEKKLGKVHEAATSPTFCQQITKENPGGKIPALLPFLQDTVLLGRSLSLPFISFLFAF